MKNYIGLNIKYLYSQKKMTQEAFGELFGIKQTTLNTYISGRSNPTIENIQKICAHFKITLDDFINEDMQRKSYADLSPVALKTKEPTAEYVTDKEKIIRAQEKTISVLEKQNALLEKTVDSLEAKLAKKAS